MNAMEKTRYHVRINFITPLLGTQPTLDVASEYIGSKYVNNGGILPDDELGTLSENVERGTTVFHKIDGMPILYDYQVKGFLKEAGKVFNGLDGVKALRSKIDSLVFIEPRQIMLHLPEGSGITYLERPLRAETAQGPRVALARSEKLEAGTWFEMVLMVYVSAISGELLRGLLTYGADKGIGQWRNGGWGRFEFTFE
jgi:hypothetical protein